MRTCTKCHIERPLTCFYERKSRNNGTYQSWCRACISASRKEWSRRNRAYCIQDATLRGKARLKQLRDFIREYLSNHPCIDCQITDPEVLEFDHVRGVEYRNVCDLVARKVGDTILLAEIAKCDVRCANCHRKITAVRRRDAQGTPNLPI
jgi:hypothetical protein